MLPVATTAETSPLPLTGAKREGTTLEGPIPKKPRTDTTCSMMDLDQELVKHVFFPDLETLGFETTVLLNFENGPLLSEDVYTYLLKKMAMVSREKKIKWFLKNPVRKEIFKRISLMVYTIEGPPRDINSRIQRNIDAIWTTCTYTAPVVFSKIVPKASYSGKEESFIKLCLPSWQPNANSSASDLSAYIEYGLENLKQRIKLSEESGRAFLCNLTQGSHLFVVQKKAPNHCLIFQSFLYLRADSSTLQEFLENSARSYTLREFLENKDWHTEWTIEELVTALHKVITREIPVVERIEAYQKLFFIAVDADDFKGIDAAVDYCGTQAFAFVASDPY